MDVEISEVADFLAGCVPFDTLEHPALVALVPRLTQRYHRRGTTIIEAAAPNDALHVIRSGVVELTDRDGTLIDTRDVGDSFGYSTLPTRRPSLYRYVAAEDTLTMEMPREVFLDIASRYPEFGGYYHEESDRVRGDLVAARVDASGGDPLSTPVEELLARDAVTAPSTTPISDAARIMSERRVSSLLIVDGDRLVGILSDRDLRSRVLAAGLDPARPVSEAMTRDPFHVGGDTRAFDATLLMMDRGVHHLPVLDPAGRSLGVVTSTDLLRLAQADPVYLAARISRAASPGAVAEQVGKLPPMVAELTRKGMPAADVSRVITATTDAATRRLLDLAEAELGPPPVTYAWLVLGSQARGELGVASDQDSALVLASEPADDTWFAEVSARVRDGLAEAGFPVCPGDMMASNRRWRMTVDEWAARVDTWVHRPESENVLDAQVAFDLRAVAGDTALADRVRSHVRDVAAGSPRFLAHLARTAADWQPPLGFLRGLVVEKRGQYRNTLDIKAGGLSAIVQMARLQALAAGLTEVGTVARLEAAVSAGAMARGDARALLTSFDFLRDLQLRHHADLVSQGRDPDNHLDPSTVSSRDRNRLKQAFRAIAEQQEALALRYPIRQM
jgi:CBS domain-containing protein